MTEIDFDRYRNFSNQTRQIVLKLVHHANASHVGGALSMADILSVLYNGFLKISPETVSHPERDRFLLSKGHACTALYAVLAQKGFFSEAELFENYTHDGAFFTSHTNHHLAGVEISTGSLGHALPVACGLALAAKRQNKKYKTVVLLSDGELNEGSNWESILFAPHHKLDNLVAIVDYNHIQSFGRVEDVLNLAPLSDKFKAFGWETIEVDGHVPAQILEALSKYGNTHEKPLALIAQTIKGKGVDFMENNLMWHYKSPNEDQLAEALRQLQA